MALNGIVDKPYVVDILYCTVIDDSWGIGKSKSKKHDKQLTF
jgi:hypothetical protein